MGQQVRRRKQTVIPFSANNKIAKDLARGYLYRDLTLNLTCQPTVTAANNTQAKTGKGDEWACVKKIEVIANGTDVVKSISGRMLRWCNLIWNHALPNLTSKLGDGATANPSCSSSLILPFWMYDSIRPIDTCLNSALLSNLQIVITWGNYTDVSSSATAWTTEPSIDVYSNEAFGLQGQFGSWRVYEISQDVSATNADLQLQLPVGPVYRGFAMAIDDGGTEKSGLLNNFKLTSGTNVFADIDSAALQAEQTARRGIDRDSLAPRSSLSSLDGFLYYDHVLDGYLSEGIDTIGFAELTAHFDVTKGAGTTTLLIVPQQVIPVRKAGAGG